MISSCGLPVWWGAVFNQEGFNVSSYTVRVILQMVTDGKVDHETTMEDHSDNAAVHGIKCITVAKALGKALPEASEELFRMAAGAAGKK